SAAMRVLAVADEPGVLSLLENACRNAGVTCVGASSSENALASLREWGPGYFAIVLIDAALLAVSCWECWKLLRQVDPDLSGVFLINLERGEAEGALDLGAEDYIVKPASLQDLTAKLKYLRSHDEKPHAVRFGRLRFNLGPDSTYLDGKPLDLTHHESRI